MTVLSVKHAINAPGRATITSTNRSAAAHPSPTTAYLAPPGPEPQQRVRHREHRRRGTEADHHRDFHNGNHYPSAAAHTLPSHASGCGRGAELAFFETERHQYAQDHLLQSYEVYVPEEPTEPDEPGSLNDKYWVIYIHGGYYRDPKITAGSFHPTLSLLLDSPLYAHAASLIAGFASLNYRLSAHPAYPQDADKTSSYELRHAKHPDHIDDVLTAIGVLQKKYRFGERYLLVGHSVGATMAFQAALSQQVPWNPTAAAKKEGRVEPPMAVLGVEGIYDFPLIVRTVPEEVRDKYQAPTEGAFGKNRSIWLEVSPAQYSANAYARSWGPGRRLVIVAHSREDELVDWDQVRAIQQAFAARVEGDRIKLEIVELKGKHHEIWENGQELARAIAEAMRSLKVVDNAAPRGAGAGGVERTEGPEVAEREFV